jgi:hypothetical protein
MIDSFDGFVSENPGEAKRGGWSRRGGVDAESAMLLEASVCSDTHTRTVGDGYEIARRGRLEERFVRLIGGKLSSWYFGGGSGVGTGGRVCADVVGVSGWVVNNPSSG